MHHYGTIHRFLVDEALRAASVGANHDQDSRGITMGTKEAASGGFRRFGEKATLGPIRGDLPEWQAGTYTT